MNLPKLIADLVDAQNSHDALAYVACFSETAVVFDEGRTHRGKAEIRRWIENANSQYQTDWKPLKFEESPAESLLTAEVTGTFPGSPVTLQFHLVVEDDRIQSLRVTC